MPGAAVAVALVFAAACGATDRPVADAAGRRPAKADTGHGAEIYRQHCAQCHGAEFEGSATGPSLRSEVYKPDNHPDEIMVSAVRNGQVQHHWTFGNMPAHPDFSDADVEDVVAYVREQQQARGFLPYPGDPRTARRGGFEGRPPTTVPRHIHGSPF